ncbi:TPA: D-glycero-beta-D-manno-heptose-1,7-bisphosphate 7-phosphatase [bacterium]|nr:D-glycero-beta-D-manno-heptose-1,7-bisphosphate 7-phosphatase [bacterium]
MKPSCVFIDRDGVINEELYDYVKKKEDFRLLPNVGKAIRLLNENNVLAIMISNQAGIGKGLYSEDTMEEINSLMKEKLANEGAYLDAIYYCPHHPDNGCFCRKPEPGMLEKAAHNFNLDLKNCIMIGDRIQDIEAGKRIGCKTILVLTGYGKKMLENKENWQYEPDFITDNLYEAVNLILAK